MENAKYEVIWPRGRQAIKTARLAKRLDTLQGKTIGELWDWLFYGQNIFPILESELARRYPGIRFVSYEAFGSTHGRDEAKVLEALPDKLKQYRCDAFISGLGC